MKWVIVCLKSEPNLMHFTHAFVIQLGCTQMIMMDL